MTARRIALALPLLAVGLAVAAPVPKLEGDPGPATKQQLRTARQRMSDIILAMHNYESANQTLPANVTDGKGKVLLSWRVLLLPYLEQDELFKKFDLTEAWDGPNNRKLIADMPDCFAPARGKAKNAGETFYQGFEGDGTLFQPGRRMTIVGITDGTSNSIAVVEAGEPVAWTKPADIPFDPKAAELPKLGGVFDGEFFVGMCDGSVRLALTKHIDGGHFRHMVTTADGMVLNSDAALGWDWMRK
jgi:hypothetical protein